MKRFSLLLTIAFLALLWTAAPLQAAAPTVSYRELVEWYSPVIVQDLVCTELADYITRIDYDGNDVGNDNWDNLANFERRRVGNIYKLVPVSKARPLPAYVYYSVVESETHYFITYALFHPVDDLSCHSFSHENDLEGIVMTVFKDGTPYGRLRTVQLQKHNDYYQYRAPGVTDVSNGTSDFDSDDPVSIDTTYPGVHPVVFVEGGGHGLREKDTGGAPSVRYYYTGIAEDPDDVGMDHVGYDLLSIFAEMWEKRTDCCGAGHLFDSLGAYTGQRFSVAGIGRKFDGNNGKDDAASPPWDWQDNDDGLPRGEWFMDPADYQDLQFNWSEPFSLNYVFNPFVNDELCGDIFNGTYGSTTLRGLTTLRHGPYTVVCDVTIPADQYLVIEPGVTLRFAPGTRIIADGGLIAHGHDGTIRFESTENPAAALVVNGTLMAGSGGEIGFSTNGSLQFANMTTLRGQETSSAIPVAAQRGSADSNSELSPNGDETEQPAENLSFQLFLPVVQR